MIKVSLKQAQSDLDHLLDEAGHGEEVLITRENGLSYRIVPFEAPRPRPVFGSAKGLIRIHEGFDEPLEDFKDYEP